MGGSVPNLDEVGIKITDPKTQSSLRAEVARLLDLYDSARFPGAQPVSFSRKHLKELRERDYFLCEKSDGIRCLLYFTVGEHGQECHYLIDRNNDYYYVPDLHFPQTNPEDPKSEIDWASFITNTIIDGELLIDKLPNGDRQLKYLAFDCLVHNKRICVDRTRDGRLGKLKELIFKPYTMLCKQFPEDASRWGFKRPPSEPLKWFAFKSEEKTIYPAYHVKTMIENVIPGLMHDSDGLIFTCKETPYRFGTDQNILKWKRPEQNTIDFQVDLRFQELAQNGASQVTYDYDAIPRILLHVDPEGDEEFGELFVTPSDWSTMKDWAINHNDGLDGQVVECYRDDKGDWRFYGFRDDKMKANHRTTAKSVLQSIEESVTADELKQNSDAVRDEWKQREAEKTKRREDEKKRKAEEQQLAEKRSRAS